MLKLIVGLGNPGSEYAKTRHNAGFWFLEKLANEYGGNWRAEKKFFSEYAEVSIAGNVVRLIKPHTFMNASGRAVAAVVNFYRIKAEEIFVAHDELDFAAGIVKTKFGGGHGGHNGLRDIISALDSRDFYRLRFGIGRPQDKNQVINYVLKTASKDEMEKIDVAINEALAAMKIIFSEQNTATGIEKATQFLHSK
ncbi:MAG: aminoacyl-tRNA hydrolase [Cardiobacteriaceae bacterium]|nr:aminoacyl-tRNA hydrolase [Cardiobacteriaceae bacterium]